MNNHTTLTLIVTFLCACLASGSSFGNNNNILPAAPGQIQSMSAMCQSYCSGNSPKPCPPECTRNYFDSWQPQKRRINGGLDGLSFDDYLFLRLLGRDSLRVRK